MVTLCELLSTPGPPTRLIWSYLSWQDCQSAIHVNLIMNRSYYMSAESFTVSRRRSSSSPAIFLQRLLQRFQYLIRLDLSSVNLSRIWLGAVLSPPYLPCRLTLQYLNLSNTQIDDLSPLPMFQALHHLKLFGCCNIVDLSPLAYCTSLKSLDVTAVRAIALPSLSLLRSLQHLDISYSRISDIWPLLSVSDSLISLNISSTSITDLRPLSSCRRLELLALCVCAETIDCGPLSGCHSLRQVNLNGTYSKSRQSIATR
uniref:Uncharacterized protein n=1 Tax=Spongospora subterranea TaxID=70186 RepID=A0A0H5R9J8_9EUKA|eukprot:CRZ10790.1 hypothetical protein [Spongospora subterranea]